MNKTGNDLRVGWTMKQKETEDILCEFDSIHLGNQNEQLSYSLLKKNV